MPIRALRAIDHARSWTWHGWGFNKDTFIKSTKKKYKDHHSRPIENDLLGSEPLGSAFHSYKDRLVGAIPGGYEHSFGFATSMQEDVESDNEECEPSERCVAIGLSREEKLRIRAPWAFSLIVKTFWQECWVYVPIF